MLWQRQTAGPAVGMVVAAEQEEVAAAAAVDVSQLDTSLPAAAADIAAISRPLPLRCHKLPMLLKHCYCHKLPTQCIPFLPLCMLLLVLLPV